MIHLFYKNMQLGKLKVCVFWNLCLEDPPHENIHIRNKQLKETGILFHKNHSDRLSISNETAENI